MADLSWKEIQSSNAYQQSDYESRRIAAEQYFEESMLPYVKDDDPLIVSRMKELHMASVIEPVTGHFYDAEDPVYDPDKGVLRTAGASFGRGFLSTLAAPAGLIDFAAEKFFNAPYIQVGAAVQEDIARLFPEGPSRGAVADFLIKDVPAGVGSTVGFYVPGLALGGPAGAAVMGALSNAGGTYLDLRGRTLTGDTTRLVGALAISGGLGAMEGIPLTHFYKGVGHSLAAKTVDRMLPKYAASFAGRNPSFFTASIEALEELTQESIQQFGESVAMEQLYGMEQNILYNVLHGGGVGMVTGFLMGGIGAKLGYLKGIEPEVAIEDQKRRLDHMTRDTVAAGKISVGDANVTRRRLGLPDMVDDGKPTTAQQLVDRAIETAGPEVITGEALPVFAGRIEPVLKDEKIAGKMRTALDELEKEFTALADKKNTGKARSSQIEKLGKINKRIREINQILAKETLDEKDLAKASKLAKEAGISLEDLPATPAKVNEEKKAAEKQIEDSITSAPTITTYRVGTKKGIAGTFYGTKIENGFETQLPLKGEGVLDLVIPVDNEGDAGSAPLADAFDFGKLPITPAARQELDDIMRDKDSNPQSDVTYTSDTLAAYGLKLSGIEVIHIRSEADPSKVISVDLRSHSIEELRQSAEAALVPKGQGEAYPDYFWKKDDSNKIVKSSFQSWEQTPSGQLKVYRGTEQGRSRAKDVSPDFMATEGVGLYVANSADLAERFGKVESIEVTPPSNPLVVDNEEAYLLTESEELFAPIQFSDSTWLKLNKQAIINTGTTTKNFGSKTTSGTVQRELTKLMQEVGYDAVLMKQGSDEWMVLLNAPKPVAPTTAEPLFTSEKYNPAEASSRSYDEIQQEIDQTESPLDVPDALIKERNLVMLKDAQPSLKFIQQGITKILSSSEQANVLLRRLQIPKPGIASDADITSLVSLYEWFRNPEKANVQVSQWYSSIYNTVAEALYGPDADVILTSNISGLTSQGQVAGKAKVEKTTKDIINVILQGLSIPQSLSEAGGAATRPPIAESTTPVEAPPAISSAEGIPDIFMRMPLKELQKQAKMGVVGAQKALAARTTTGPDLSDIRVRHERYNFLEAIIRSSGGGTSVQEIIQSRTLFTPAEISRLLNAEANLAPDKGVGRNIDKLIQDAQITHLTKRDRTEVGFETRQAASKTDLTQLPPAKVAEEIAIIKLSEDNTGEQLVAKAREIGVQLAEVQTALTQLGDPKVGEGDARKVLTQQAATLRKQLDAAIKAAQVGLGTHHESISHGQIKVRSNSSLDNVSITDVVNHWNNGLVSSAELIYVSLRDFLDPAMTGQIDNVASQLTSYGGLADDIANTMLQFTGSSLDELVAFIGSRVRAVHPSLVKDLFGQKMTTFEIAKLVNAETAKLTSNLGAKEFTSFTDAKSLLLFMKQSDGTPHRQKSFIQFLLDNFGDVMAKTATSFSHDKSTWAGFSYQEKHENAIAHIVNINLMPFFDFRTGEVFDSLVFSGTVLHELVHSITSDITAAVRGEDHAFVYDSVQLERARIAYAEITKLRLDLLNNLPPTLLDRYDYELSSEDEIIAAFMSDPSFRNAIRSRYSGGASNFFDKLVDIISRILGITKEEPGLYNALSNIMELAHTQQNAIAKKVEDLGGWHRVLYDRVKGDRQDHPMIKQMISGTPVSKPEIESAMQQVFPGSEIEEDADGHIWVTLTTATSAEPLKLMVKRKDVRPLADITPTKVAEMAALGMTVTPGMMEVDAVTRFLKKHVQISLGPESTRPTLWHEIYHAFKGMVQFTPRERQWLQLEYGSNEEAEANAFALYDPNVPNSVFRKIFGTMWDFIAALFGSPKANIKKMFKDIKTGKYYQRAQQETSGLRMRVNTPEERERIARGQEITNSKNRLWKTISYNISKMFVAPDAKLRSLLYTTPEGRDLRLLIDERKRSGPMATAIARKTISQIYPKDIFDDDFLSLAGTYIELKVLASAAPVYAARRGEPLIMPKGRTLAKVQDELTNFAAVHGLSPNEMAKIEAAADAEGQFWEAELKTMLAVGAIDRDEYDNMKAYGYYAPIIHLDFHNIIERMWKRLSPEVRARYEMQEREGGGKTVETDRRAVMEHHIYRTVNIINEALADAALLELSMQPNPIGARLFNEKRDELGIDEAVIHAKVNNKAVAIAMPTYLAKEWLAGNPVQNKRLMNTLSWVTLVKPLKKFAVGLNPMFAPVSFAYEMWHMPMTMEGVEAYGRSYLQFLPKVGVDLAETFLDAWRFKGAKFDAAAKDGLFSDIYWGFEDRRPALERSQGKYKDMYRKFEHAASYLNRVMDIWPRLALRERNLKNALAKNPNPSAQERAMMEREASQAAANMINFGDRGYFVGSYLDAFIPFSGAAFAGVRGPMQLLKERPGLFAWKVGEIMGLSIMSAMAMMKWDEDAWKAASTFHKDNYVMLPIPFSTFTDDEGQVRHNFLSVPVDPTVRPIWAAGRYIAEFLNGEEVKVSRLVNSILSVFAISPQDATFPLARAIAAFNNYDTFKKDQIWKGGEVAAGYEVNQTTNPFLEWIGREADELGFDNPMVSPARIQTALGTVFTNSNDLLAFATIPLTALVGSLPPQFDKSTIREAILNVPGVRRWVKTTPAYGESERVEVDKIQKEEGTRRIRQEREFEKLTDAFYDQKTFETQMAVWDYMMSQPPQDFDRLRTKLEVDSHTYKMPDKSWWRETARMVPQSRAKAFWKRYSSSTPAEQQVMRSRMQRVYPMRSREFWLELSRLQQMDRAGR